MRRITQDDANLIFNWANDDEVRKNAINTHKIKWEEHISWFNKKLLSEDTYMLIGLLNSEPVGQIRFDKENKDYTIDYSIEKKYRGKGLGTEIIKAGMKTLSEIIHKPFTIIAQVKEENIASAKIFTKLQFIKSATVFKNNSAINYFKLIIN